MRKLSFQLVWYEREARAPLYLTVHEPMITRSRVTKVRSTTNSVCWENAFIKNTMSNSGHSANNSVVIARGNSLQLFLGRSGKER